MIEIRVDTRDAERFLDRVQRQQIPFATSVALNKTAQAAQESIKTEMQRVLDKPRPYTLGGTFMRPSTKRLLEAVVGLKDQAASGRAAGKYLQAQVSGGARRTTGYELALTRLGALPQGWRALPAKGAKLDRYGNLNQAQLTEIIGALKSGTRVFKGKGKRLAATGYFVARRGVPQTAHLDPGIYYRIERAGQSAIIPVLVFAERTQYRKRLDIYRTVRRTVARRFNTEFSIALQRALATAR